MAQTLSTMKMELGAEMPAFVLTDTVTGKPVSSATFTDERVIVVMFICNHCPFVKHIREELARLGRDYASKPVAIVAISSNDVENYPDDAPDKMAQEAADAGWNFAYCFDPSQEVAKRFGAACTPDFFVFGPERTLVYRGQLDDSRPGNDEPVTGADLRAAIDAVLEGGEPSGEQKPSVGCNIKWKPGNEPDYFKS